MRLSPRVFPAVVAALAAAAALTPRATAQQLPASAEATPGRPAASADASPKRPASGIVFRASVDVVSVTAVVRDRKGNVVPFLERGEFEVIDAGQKRPILDLQASASAPASVALLLDGSGSMRVGAANHSARIVADAVLSGLDPLRDDASLMSFDSRLIMLREFTRDFDSVRRALDDVEAWGITSLYDAIAGTAGVVGQRTKNRRAIVVLTDGADNASGYAPEEVAAIASSIDVPVYVFSLAETGLIEVDRAAVKRRSALAQLAHATGGDYLLADTPKRMQIAIARLLEELRHQYVISFEASRFAGLRRIEVRTPRRAELKVRARGWYSGRPED
jgi:VWFA-related protein